MIFRIQYKWVKQMKVKEDIIGKEVVDTSGIVIGKVMDVEVDFETQKLEAFIVGKGGGFAGFGMSKDTLVPYDIIKIVGDKVLLTSEIH